MTERNLVAETLGALAAAAAASRDAIQGLADRLRGVETAHQTALRGIQDLLALNARQTREIARYRRALDRARRAYDRLP